MAEEAARVAAAEEAARKRKQQEEEAARLAAEQAEAEARRKEEEDEQRRHAQRRQSLRQWEEKRHKEKDARQFGRATIGRERSRDRDRRPPALAAGPAAGNGSGLERLFRAAGVLHMLEKAEQEELDVRMIRRATDEQLRSVGFTLGAILKLRDAL